MIPYKPMANTPHLRCTSHPIIPLGQNGQYRMIPYKPIANTVIDGISPNVYIFQPNGTIIRDVI